MVYYSRALLSGRQKFAFSLGVILLAIYVMFNPRAMEAFMAFCFGGIVPGTNIVLSPDVILTGVVVLTVLLLGGIFLRMKLRATRKRRQVYIPVRVVTENHMPIPVVDSVADTPPEVTAKPVSVAVTRHEKRTFFMFAILRATRDGLFFVGVMIGRGLHGLWRGLVSAAIFLGSGILRALAGLGKLISASAVLLWRGLRGVGSLLYMGLVWIGRVMIVLLTAAVALSLWAAANIAAFWRWSKPYLLKFDEWLEIQARHGESYARRKLRQYEFARILHAIFRQAKKSLSDMRPKLLVQTVRKKITAVKN